MLSDDPDRDFLLSGIRYGFCIANSALIDTCTPATVPNYVQDDHIAAVEKAVSSELDHDHYRRASPSAPPILINAIGCVMKKDDTARIIHDLSRPLDGAANDLADDMECQLDSLEHICSVIAPGDILCKIDLRSAYRVVHIHPSNYAVTGLKWRLCSDISETVMYDTRLPFGARLSPAIFNRLTQSVCRFLRRAGFLRVFVYTDDFIIIESLIGTADRAFNLLRTQLRKLGFWIAYDKLEGPCTCLVYLGAELDTSQMTVRITDSRLAKLQSEIKEVNRRSHSSLRQLQRLIGKMNFACVGVRGGRAFMRRLHDAANLLAHQSHRIKHDGGMKADLRWWEDNMDFFNGKRLPLHPVDLSRPLLCVSADACIDGAGAFFQGDWVYSAWSVDLPHLFHLPICYKEAAALCLAADRWAASWVGSHIIMLSDSTVATAIVPRLTCAEPLLMPMLRRLFLLTEQFNFSFEVQHIAGINNRAADTISRLHEPGGPRKLLHLLRDAARISGDTSLEKVTVIGHLSFDSCRFVDAKAGSRLSRNPVLHLH
jgi:hypothetical protein